MNSFLSWIGGKNRLKKEIVKRFPNEKYDYYVEVFGGAAWVLFYKDRHAETEVYNDLNGELVNLFKIVKYHCGELQNELTFLLNSRQVFECLKEQNTDAMTDIQRAARFFWLIKTSFGAKGNHFGCVKKDICSMTEYLSDIHHRLQTVAIENRDFGELIDSFKSKNALLYLDPPYYGTENYYAVNFNVKDHERLHDYLAKVSCKFVLTYNDCSFIKNLYSSYNIYEIERFNNLSTQSKSNSRYSELIITNY